MDLPVDRGKGLAALHVHESLPAVAAPGGHYLPFQLGPGNLCYLSGYISRYPDGKTICGTHVDNTIRALLPDDFEGVLDADAGSEAARTCALGHLAILKDCCGGLSNVKRFIKVTCFVNVLPTPVMCAIVAESANRNVASAPWFSESPKVANGYTDLITQVLGGAGAHARSAVCASGLPFGAAVEVEAIVELMDASLVAARD
mmetsp:Transcript_14605/g.44603  ORF Transcript_14605/g.44603 Transcript_14605/m.44603 type:complete len:202 (-) Transcript_14605:320-925(-)